VRVHFLLHFCSGVEVLDPVEELTVAPSSSEEPAGLALHQLAVRDRVFTLEKEKVAPCVGLSQHVATCCNMLQHVATKRAKHARSSISTCIHSSVPEAGMPCPNLHPVDKNAMIAFLAMN